MFSTILWSLKASYSFLDSVVLEVLRPHEGAIDPKGFTSKVALYPGMFTSGLRLSFCRSVCEVLDFLGMAPMLLQPNEWWILVCCYIVWCRALEEVDPENLYLTSWEYFSTQYLLKHKWNTCNLRSHGR